IFDGVRALPPASIVSLAAGAATLRTYAAPLAPAGPAPSVDDAVAEMAEILLALQGSLLEAHPDAVLQLTGGHDSRILLGAVPEKVRRGLGALTLGEPDHPDVVVAARLCQRYGMRHDARRLDDEHPSPAEAHAVSLAAAEALECLASPMALAPL